MKVLMFGWEYPPHVFGGLATANFGISQGLHAQGDVDITLCLPHPFGDEDRSAAKIVAMNCVPIAWRDVNYDYVKQRMGSSDLHHLVRCSMVPPLPRFLEHVPDHRLGQQDLVQQNQGYRNPRCFTYLRSIHYSCRERIPPCKWIYRIITDTT